MTFGIAPDIIEHFSQDETSGGQGKLAVFTRGAAVTDPVTGHRVMGAKVAVPNIRGNTAPVSAQDIQDDVSGKLSEGDIWVFTIKRLTMASNDSQDSSMLIERLGRTYVLNTGNDWHYARGNRYVAFLDRGELGV